MNWKEFLKPSVKKIIILVLALLILPMFACQAWVYESYYCGLSHPLLTFTSVIEGDFSALFFLLVHILLIYIILSLIFYKIKNKHQTT